MSNANAKIVEQLETLLEEMKISIQKLDVSNTDAAPKAAKAAKTTNTDAAPKAAKAAKTTNTDKAAKAVKATKTDATPKAAKAAKTTKTDKAPKGGIAKAEATSSSSATKMYRPSFFKKIFMEDHEKYLDILWTHKEIEEALKLPEVASKKKEDDKFAKIARILYDVSIKDDVPKGRKAKFELAFEKFNG